MTTTTTRTLRIRPNNTGTRFPCGLCDGTADPDASFAVETPSGAFVCDACALRYDPAAWYLVLAARTAYWDVTYEDFDPAVWLEALQLLGYCDR